MRVISSLETNIISYLYAFFANSVALVFPVIVVVLVARRVYHISRGRSSIGLGGVFQAVGLLMVSVALPSGSQNATSLEVIISVMGAGAALTVLGFWINGRRGGILLTRFSGQLIGGIITAEALLSVWWSAALYTQEARYCMVRPAPRCGFTEGELGTVQFISVFLLVGLSLVISSRLKGQRSSFSIFRVFDFLF